MPRAKNRKNGSANTESKSGSQSGNKPAKKSFGRNKDKSSAAPRAVRQDNTPKQSLGSSEGSLQFERTELQLQPDSGINQSRDPLKWRAYEFYYHEKSFGWYALFLLGSMAISALAWLISGMDDYISSGIILAALIGLTIYAGRKPEKREYEIDGSNLTINNRPMSLSAFRYFWVEELGTHTEITLVGLKRSTPPTTLYIKDQKLADEVISRIGTSLPEDSASKNPFDWLARKIKF